MVRKAAVMDCVVCRIVAGAADASVVYDDDRLLAFCDLNPVNPGHLLVVPKVHSVGLAGLDEADGSRMFKVAQSLAAAVRSSGLRCQGVNLFLADGKAAGQEVLHVHLHVFPRYVGTLPASIPVSGERPAEISMRSPLGFALCCDDEVVSGSCA
ncbi:MAG: histidine triad family protein [Pseudonocardiales bacterium]|nr:histidine triad family protein [Pseudonocardiales bacterium]